MPTLSAGGVIIGTGGKRYMLFPTAARIINGTAYSTESWESLWRGDQNVVKNVLSDDPPASPISRSFADLDRAATFVRIPTPGSQDLQEISWLILEYTLPYAVDPNDMLHLIFMPKIFGKRTLAPDTNWPIYGPYTNHEDRPCTLQVFHWPIPANTSYYGSSSPTFQERQLLTEVILRAIATWDGPLPPSDLEVVGRDENALPGESRLSLIYDAPYYPHRHNVPIEPALLRTISNSAVTKITLGVMFDSIGTGYLNVGHDHEQICHIQTYDSPLYIDATEQERGVNALCLTQEGEELLLAWEYFTDGNLEAKPASLEVALCTTDCSAGTPGVEIVGAGYTRATLGVAAPTPTGTGVPARGVYKNPAPLTFGTAAADWEPVRSIAIFDDTGRYLFFANFPVSDALEVTEGVTPTIDTNDLWITTHLNFLRALLTADALLTIWPDFADAPREFISYWYLSTGAEAHVDPIPLVFSPITDGAIYNSEELVLVGAATGVVTRWRVFRPTDTTNPIIDAVGSTTPPIQNFAAFPIGINQTYRFRPLTVSIRAEAEDI